jgi:hypothetical protein
VRRLPSLLLATLLVLTIVVVGAGDLAGAGLTSASPPLTLSTGMGMLPIVPTRVLDTRVAGTRPTPGRPATIDLSKAAGLGTSVTGLVANVTTIGTQTGVVNLGTCNGTGSLTLPVVAGAQSEVLWLPTPNNQWCAASTVTVDLVIDVEGLLRRPVSNGTLQPVPTIRLADTRAAPTGPTTAILKLPAPAGATGASLTIRAGATTAAGGYLVAWPCSAPRPLAASTTIPASGVSATTLLTPATTTLCVYTSTPSWIVVDVHGWVVGRTGQWFVPVTAQPLIDSAKGLGVVGPLGASTVLTLGIPVDSPARQAMVGLATVSSPTAGWLGFSSDGVAPTDGVADAIAGTATFPVVVPITGGALQPYVTSPDSNLRIEVSGWLSSPLAAPGAPRRSTISRYLSGLTGDPAADGPKAQSVGCADSGAATAQNGYVILAVGRQVLGSGAQQWFTGKVISYADLATVISSYAKGWAGCHGPPVTIAIGTSNYGTSGTLGAPGGAEWAALVAGIAAPKRVTIAGANDIEPSWGPVTASRAWVDAYVAATSRPLLDTGSADGCPILGQATHPCNNGWTQDDVWYVATGAGPNVYAMPEIYSPNGAQAEQWALISAAAMTADHAKLRVGAILSEAVACAQAGPCPGIDNSPTEAWSKGWGALLGVGGFTTAQARVTDIRWGW